MTIVVTMEQVICTTCGILFCVTGSRKDLARTFPDDDDAAIHCPNGHRNYFKGYMETRTKEQLQQELQSAKERLVAALDRAERAEAQLAGHAEHKDASACTGQQVRDRVEQVATDAYVCPACGKRYKYKGAFRTHVSECRVV